MLLSLVIGAGIGAAGVLYLLRPTPSVEPAPSHTVIIERLVALGQLEVMAVHTRDILRKQWEYLLPFTRSKVLIGVAGEGRVCIDFAKVQVLEQDWSQRTIGLRLPKPYLCSVRIDPAQSQVYDADFSIIEWAGGNEAERFRQALAEAQETLRVRLQQQIPHAAAQAQAEKLLRRLCEEMGWQKITIEYQ